MLPGRSVATVGQPRSSSTQRARPPLSGPCLALRKTCLHLFMQASMPPRSLLTVEGVVAAPSPVQGQGPRQLRCPRPTAFQGSLAPPPALPPCNELGSCGMCAANPQAVAAVGLMVGAKLRRSCCGACCAQPPASLCPQGGPPQGGDPSPRGDKSGSRQCMFSTTGPSEMV